MCYLGAKLCDTRCLGRERRKIHEFVRVGEQIIKLIWIDRRVHKLVPPTPDHHQWCDRALRQVFADYFVRGVTAFERWQQAAAIEWCGIRRHASGLREFNESRQNI